MSETDRLGREVKELTSRFGRLESELREARQDNRALEGRVEVLERATRTVPVKAWDRLPTTVIPPGQS